MQTATVAISKFTGTTGFDTPYGTIMAAGVVVTVPLLLAVLVFQRRIRRRPHRRWRQVARTNTSSQIWRSRNAAAAPDLSGARSVWWALHPAQGLCSLACRATLGWIGDQLP